MPKVIAVSRALPRWIEIGGRPVETSIVRDASPVPLVFGPDGPEENRTAVHTEHVLAFPAEHYDYWAKRLGVARDAWRWCHWGENLTLAGIDEHRLRVGDLVRVGASAVFEVTSPRIPCFKLSWRLGQPEMMLRQLSESGRTGFYLRVLAPGLIGAGDPVSVESPHAEHITIADLSRLLCDPAVDDAKRLRLVRATPSLGRQASEMLRLRINSVEDRALGKVGRWSGWRRFVVAAVTDEARDVRSMILAPKDGAAIAPYRAGQFLTVRVPVPGRIPLSRTWSLSDYDGFPSSYRLSIKKSRAGAASDWIHDAATVGTVLEVRPPSGRFTLDRSGFAPVVMISAGIGITPMLSMLKAHLARGADAPPLVWMHSTRNGETHAFRQEAARLLAGSQDCVRQVLYTAPLASDRVGVDYDRPGRLTLRALLDVVERHYAVTLVGRKIELPGYAADFYICGPAACEEMVRDALQRGNVDARSIHSETFSGAARVPGRAAGAAGARTGAGAVQTAEVCFTRSKVTTTWHADDGETLLELAEVAGLNPEHGCRAGACQTCEATIGAGSVLHEPEPVVPPPAGRVLLCCARPSTPRVEIDL
jgi:ferredoxin-NADP reductase/MOSC domain-containing protein YiiM